MSDDWSLRVFRMAVGSRYPTPFCAVAERQTGPGRKEVVNAEGRTAEEAERLARKRTTEVNDGLA